jgi:multicomponent Na+:H+ antiporter subunit D
MKTGLFYTSGALKYKYGIHEITSFGQIYKDMPTTATAMVVCALSMVGLPPFAGFFSKWYLAMGAIENGQYLYVAILILSSLLSAIYFFRIFEELFMGKRIEERKKDGPLPWQMLLPLGAVAAAVIGLGLGNSSLVSELLKPTLLEVFLV